MMVVTLGVLVALWIAFERCDSTHPDVGTDAEADAGADAEAGADVDVDGGEMSPHEREEAAKDDLELARAALEAGDVASANAALDAAQEMDPGNPDIEVLRAKVQAAETDGG